jgi:hypothetical protein
MKLISITDSTKKGKKLMAKFQTDSGRTRTTHFGAAGMDDYTLTGDKEQRARYLSRHRKDLDSGDPTKAGHLAWYILWGDSTSRAENISHYKRRFNL